METITLSRWDTRFWAWVIDFILIYIVISVVTTFLRFAFSTTTLWDFTFGGPFSFELSLRHLTLFFY